MRPPIKKASERLKKPLATTGYSPDQNPLDVLRKSLFRWLSTKVGVFGSAVLIMSFTLWVGWDSVARVPGFDTVISEWQEWRGLPQAKGDRFSIVIAQLENDAKGEHRGLITDALRDRFNDQIEILRTSITISTTGDEKLQEAEVAGHEQARALLRKANANVMIWGEALSSDTKAPVRLHWTVNTEAKSEKFTGRYLPDQTSYDLPALFWADLDDVLGLVITSQTNTLLSSHGTFVADKLKSPIRRVRTLLTSETAISDKRPELWMILANSLSIYGQQSGDSDALQEAVLAYRKVLTKTTRERIPLDWAATQYNLGHTLQMLGEREASTTRLNEAVEAYRDALKEFTRAQMPLDWAATQVSLGVTLQTLGEREASTTRLNEAVAAYRNALKEFTRAQVPLDWAIAQNGLGNALSTLGEREGNTARLNEAVAAYREALKEFARRQVPLYWAATQHNLGNALLISGEREGSITRLNEAVAAYRDALQERTREQVPMDWAATQNGLGNALSTLGEREGNTARLNEAVAAYRDALQERTRERVPLDWAATQNNLGNALLTLGEREGNTARLNEAVAAYRDALQECTRERAPLRWEETQHNLAIAFRILREHEKGNGKAE